MTASLSRFVTIASLALLSACASSKPSTTTASVTPSATPPRDPEPTVLSTTGTGMNSAMDRQVIGSVIRGHLHEVRGCYEKELAYKPQLGGVVTTHFTIAHTGEVISANVQDSTVNDPALEQCITQMVRGWAFPAQPQMGTVQVSYPFALERDAK
jgi:TonB family protein